jgi:hypothetical protein
VLGVEILGNVYEQFLGKVIRLTAGHQAKVETKPEVKKAGGVYYTPQHIVEYIVENTVGKLIAGKTPEEIAEIKVLDPACGSGSFLIGAYSYLLRYHLDWYVNNKPKKHKEAVFQAKENEWYLTTAEKKRILLDNVFGVDIDLQAVEVTKMSLLLKVLEHESRESIDQQMKLGLEGVLPNLGDNIKCGNSLIGPEYYELGQQGSLFNEEEMRRVNVFDWEDERKGFGGIMQRGGFDCVIGNPPWGAEIQKAERYYLNEKYPDVADFESSQYFSMKSIMLLNNEGLVGMIIPNTFALNVLARKCRLKILKTTNIYAMLDLSEVVVFAGPNVRSMVIFLSKSTGNNCQISLLRSNLDIDELRTVTQKELEESETWKELFIQETPLYPLVRRLVKRCPVLSDYCDVKQGYIPYRTTTLTKRFGRAKAEEIVKKRLWHATEQETSEYLRELQGADVRRYHLNWSGVWVRYGKWVSTYLPISVFSGPRILVREIANRFPHVLLATYTEKVFVHNPSILAVLSRVDSVSSKFILGLLNSRMMSTIFMQVAPKAKKGLFPKIIITDARRLPFPRIDLENPAEKAPHDNLVSLVDNMLELQKKYHDARMEQDKELYERQIKILDAQIDRLVYELYGLTEEEVKVVEGEK